MVENDAGQRWLWSSKPMEQKTSTISLLRACYGQTEKKSLEANKTYHACKQQYKCILHKFAWLIRIKRVEPSVETYQFYIILRWKGGDIFSKDPHQTQKENYKPNPFLRGAKLFIIKFGLKGSVFNNSQVQKPLTQWSLGIFHQRAPVRITVL